MTETTLPEDLLALLRKVDTPTVCNAIEMADGFTVLAGSIGPSHAYVYVEGASILKN